MYKIFYAEEAKKFIDELSFKKKHQIKEAIERLSQNPESGKRLTGELKSLLSYRTGDYRIIYRIYRQEIVILVLALGHRKDIYKKVARKF